MSTNAKKYSGVKCTGKRSASSRQPVITKPPVMYFEVDNCPLGRLPLEIEVQNTKYLLYCITFGNEGHFTGCVNVPNKGWHFCNGLDIYHNRGPGLKKVMLPNPPPNYRRNCCMFVGSQ